MLAKRIKDANQKCDVFLSTCSPASDTLVGLGNSNKVTFIIFFIPTIVILCDHFGGTKQCRWTQKNTTVKS